MKKIATVGTFDGMHRGHMAVTDTLLKGGAALGLLPLAISFPDHPLMVIAPERAPRLIMPPGEKVAILDGLGIETSLLDFTPELCRLSASDWLRLLRDNHQVAAIVLGYDNTFGSDGRHLRREDYYRIAAELGLTCIEAQEIPGCSSSAIRKAIIDGNIPAANSLLGHPFELLGHIVEGNRIGRTIGFPTANLRPANPSRQLLPPPGVYAARAILPDGLGYPAVANIGFRPTIDERLREADPRIEAHILGFNADIYGSPLRLQLLQLLRPEQKFPSLEFLKTQIARDADQTRAFFASKPDLVNPN